MCGRYQFTPGAVYPPTKAPVLLESHGSVAPDLLYWSLQTPQELAIPPYYKAPRRASRSSGDFLCPIRAHHRLLKKTVEVC